MPPPVAFPDTSLEIFVASSHYDRFRSAYAAVQGWDFVLRRRPFKLCDERVYYGMRKGGTAGDQQRRRQQLLADIDEAITFVKRERGTGKAIAHLLRLQKVAEGWSPPPDTPGPEKRQLPDQQLAPVRLASSNVGMRLEDASPSDGQLASTSVEALRKAAAEKLRQAISELERCNADRRFTERVKSLRKKLSAAVEKFSVEAAGGQFEIVEQTLSRFADEIDEVTLISIKSALDTTRVVLRQFTSWREYQEELREINLSTPQSEAIVSEAAEIIDQLEREPHLVDAEITDRLRSFVTPAKAGLISADSVAAPIVVALSNIMSEVARVVLAHPEIIAAIINASLDVLMTSALGLTARYVSLCWAIVNGHADRLAEYPRLGFLAGLTGETLDRTSRRTR